ncbi:MAG: hypothetical protein RJA70_1858, partial [Pseudomonadota bacterium]
MRQPLALSALLGGGDVVLGGALPTGSAVMAACGGSTLG